MSRCFPFPPPGFEPKYRIEDIEILKKEKQREKKHKKEKDKKREGKEKRDRERSDGKHKESKEKKEKHKDKKKDKDKHEDKYKVSTSDEKRLQGHSEGQREEKISKEKQLPGRIEGPGGEKILKKEDREKVRTNISAEKRSAAPFSGYNGDRKISNNSHPVEDKVPRSVQEFGKSTKSGTIESRNQLAGKISGMGPNKDQVRLPDRPSETCSEQKNKRARVDDRQSNSKGFKNETGTLVNTAVQNLAETVESKYKGVHASSDTYTEKRVEKKEKNKENGSGNNHGDVRISRGREHKAQQVRQEEKEKQEKLLNINGLQYQMEHRPTESNDRGLSSTEVTGIPHLAKDTKSSAALNENTKKRKELMANGFLHVKDNRSSKMLRPTPHSASVNGSSLKGSQYATSFNNERPGVAANITVGTKEQNLNGLQEAPLTTSCPMKPLSDNMHEQNCNIVENNVKSPHPDLKYLCEVLSVPEVEELLNIDDEEWLYSSSHLKSENPVKNSHDIAQVWAEALQLDSDNFYALPYVIPY